MTIPNLARAQIDPAEVVFFHGSFGARLNIDFSISSEEFVLQLVKDYESYRLNRNSERKLADELIYCWIASLDRASKSESSKRRVLTVLDTNTNLTLEETCIAFMVLDELATIEEFVRYFRLEEPQVQARLITDIVSRKKAYDSHAHEIVRGINRNSEIASPFGRVMLKEKLGDAIDRFLIAGVRRSGNVIDPALIENEILRAAAKSRLATLPEKEAAHWIERILSESIHDNPPCNVFLDFASNESAASKILKASSHYCGSLDAQTLQENMSRFPLLMQEHLSRLATSEKIDDLIVVLKVLGGLHFGEMENYPLAQKAVLKGLQDEVEPFFRNYSWPLTFAAMIRRGDDILANEDLLLKFPVQTQNSLRKIAEEVNTKCSVTFFCKDLREAVSLALSRRQPQNLDREK